MPCTSIFIFFFNDTATTEIYTLSLHDALPISQSAHGFFRRPPRRAAHRSPMSSDGGFPNEPFPPCGLNHYQHNYNYEDRKSTRLNSSHSQISYAVFCLKKKKKIKFNLDLSSND